MYYENEHLSFGTNGMCRTENMNLKDSVQNLFTLSKTEQEECSLKSVSRQSTTMKQWKSLQFPPELFKDNRPKTVNSEEFVEKDLQPSGRLQIRIRSLPEISFCLMTQSRISRDQKSSEATTETIAVKTRFVTQIAKKSKFDSKVPSKYNTTSNSTAKPKPKFNQISTKSSKPDEEHIENQNKIHILKPKQKQESLL